MSISRDIQDAADGGGDVPAILAMVLSECNEFQGSSQARNLIACLLQREYLHAFA
jgi:hypothetical protein